MKPAGINGADVKRLNRLTVLQYLAQHKGVSRVQLTQQTNLTKMTISNIINEFLEQGLVSAQQSESGQKLPGRKPVLLQFSQTSPVVIGIWLSRDYCSGVVTDMHLSTLGMHSIPLTEETSNTLEQKLGRLLSDLLQGVKRPVAGIGVASIGPLHLEQGVLLNPPNFFGITDFSIKRAIEKNVCCPVFVQNDMNAAVLAEKYFGAGRGHADFAYVGLTNGIGAGLMVHDRLLEGAGGFAGELGHIVVDRQGPLCHCGNRGCLETFLSVPMLLQGFEEKFQRKISGFAELCALCRQETAYAQWLKERLEPFVVGLSNLCNLFDPQVVILGHEGALLGQPYVAYVQEEVNRRVLASGFVHIPVVTSPFSTLAPLLGASAVVLERIFLGELALG